MEVQLFYLFIIFFLFPWTDENDFQNLDLGYPVSWNPVIQTKRISANTTYLIGDKVATHFGSYKAMTWPEV